LPFHRRHELDGVGYVQFAVAGHILGAAIVELSLTEGGLERTLVFSGDLGPDGARLLSQPEAVARPDYLLTESTYGDRRRPDEGDLTERLHRSIEESVSRGGKLIIPAFAVGRTQALLARINDLVEAGRISSLPVYVDSPMAVAATRSFALHPEAYSEEARRLLRAGDRPLEFPGLELVQSVEQSKAINSHPGPCVIISASGMCTAGRIKHHLKNHISDGRNTILFVGYQAGGTLGRAIQSGTSPVRIFGEWHVVQARVETIEGAPWTAVRSAPSWCMARRPRRRTSHRSFGAASRPEPRSPTWARASNSTRAPALAPARDDGRQKGRLRRVRTARGKAPKTPCAKLLTCSPQFLKPLKICAPGVSWSSSTTRTARTRAIWRWRPSA